MFNWLQNKLGITDLQQQIGKHHTQVEWEIVTERWKHVAQRLADIDDHLLEMKEMVKNHAAISEQKALDRHTEVMARLGMVLTALEKAAPQYAVSPMMQTIPLTVRGARGRPRKMKEDKKDA